MSGDGRIPKLAPLEVTLKMQQALQSLAPSTRTDQRQVQLFGRK
jgi:hypothetical protein